MRLLKKLYYFNILFKKGYDTVKIKEVDPREFKSRVEKYEANGYTTISDVYSNWYSYWVWLEKPLKYDCDYKAEGDYNPCMEADYDCSNCEYWNVIK